MDFESLTEEQKAKAMRCETMEDVLALAKAEGFDLSDDELQEMAGGTPKYHGTCIKVCATNFTWKN